MKRLRSVLAGLGALGTFAYPALLYAIEFRAIADEIAVLYDAPAADSGKRLILTRGYPVEVIIDAGQWVRVRDDSGSFAWIEAARLATERTVLVRATVVEARDAPTDTAAVVFKAENGVVLQFVGVSGGWAKLRHRSGVEGFVRLADLWGV